ncbi:helix-turn-helix domain-containing protein [Gemmata sp.]|uniref:helix-turn-helix domain-containing protein n=1 Tax=Gemmata sp. TaxID=1914242 RepID=UPI003F72A4BC
MATKSQHAPAYAPLLAVLRALREGAGLTQRDLGARLGKPQSWVHNCEVANRRMDVAEFCAWAAACGADARDALSRYLAAASADPSNAATKKAARRSRAGQS